MGCQEGDWGQSTAPLGTQSHQSPWEQEGGQGWLVRTHPWSSQPAFMHPPSGHQFLPTDNITSPVLQSPIHTPS